MKFLHINSKYMYLIPFVILGGFLFLQFSKVFIYYDDYGYLSLSYGYEVADVYGDDYNLFQLIEFMYNHYFVANGRLIFAGLFPFVYMLLGLKGVQMFIAFILTVLHLVLFYILKKQYQISNRNSILLAMLMCLIYGTLSITVHRQGTYWFAASYIYIVPSLIFLSYSYIYYQSIKLKPSNKKIIATLILAFLLGFSTEQWYVGGLVFTLGIFVLKIIQKIKFYYRDFLNFIVLNVGALPILTSPAVQNRMNAATQYKELSFVDKLNLNINTLVSSFLSNDHKFYLIVMLMFLVIMTLHLIEIKSGVKLVNIIHLILSVSFFMYIVGFRSVIQENYIILISYLFILYLLISILQFYFYLRDKKVYYSLLVFISSFGMIGSLIIVTEHPHRIFIPFYLMSILIFGEIFIRALESTLKLGALLIVIVFSISIPNSYFIYLGYSKNYDYHKANNELLEAYEVSGDKIYLDKLPDILYGSEMYYYEGFEFMKPWMEQYYDISNEVNFIYE